MSTVMNTPRWFMLGLAFAAVLLAIAACVLGVSCQQYGAYPLDGPQPREDGQVTPAPAWTNEPEIHVWTNGAPVLAPGPTNDGSGVCAYQEEYETNCSARTMNVCRAWEDVDRAMFDEMPRPMPDGPWPQVRWESLWDRTFHPDLLEFKTRFDEWYNATTGLWMKCFGKWNPWCSEVIP